MSEVTLIGTRRGEGAARLVLPGSTSASEGCPYRSQCLDLSPGTRYRITDVRENAQTLDCAVHDGGVRAVEVEPAPIPANVPSKVAYAGSKAKLAGACPYTDCPSHAYCVPDGADFEAEYRIDEVVGDPPHDYCMLDRDLTLVEFAPPDDA